MDITSYLQKTGMTATAFAKKAECSQPSMSLYISKDRKPGPKAVFRIEKASDNMVTRYDLRPDIYGEMPKRRKATRGKVRLDDLYPAEAEGERA